MRRKLPLFVERSLEQIQADQAELTSQFEATIIGQKPVSCKTGCSACCYHPVLISIMEAIPIYGSLVAHGKWSPSLKAKLKQSSDMTAGLSFEVWLLSKLACPLLDGNNRCVAYEARPFSCRVTLATGDPFYCDSQRLGKDTTILPRQEALTEFHKREKDVLRKHGLLHLTMPVGRAVLMAERVCSGALTLEGVDKVYALDHLADDA